MICDDERKPTIVYDGACPFCLRQMERIRRWDRRSRFAFMASQDPNLLAQFPQLADQDLLTGLRLVESVGDVHVGADAVYHIARRLPRTQRLAWIYRIPGLRFLWRKLYALIAARRQRQLADCGTGCSVGPDAQD